MTLSAGSRLGPYEILAPIGAGGMGEVYRARDPRLEREVALKVLPTELAGDRDRLSRFEHEARAASALNHPNIITIYDIGQDQGITYIVMELVDGRTLREILADGPLEPKQFSLLSAQIADGLAKAHAAGIVHRDLKPDNVMVSRDGFVKILDFGLAKRPPMANQGSQAATFTRGTEPGTVIGTVEYMSPEQATGRPVDHRSDQFSFGAVLYEMAAGRKAFHRTSPIETLSAILKEDPEPLETHDPSTLEPLRRIVARCLAKDPEGRYGSTRDLAHDLREMGDSVSSSRGPLPRGLSAFGARTALIAAAALALLLSIVVFLTRSRGGQIDSVAVLPLETPPSDPETEYLGQGIADSLIQSLSRLPDLRVIARSSVARYKGQAADPQKIGKELGVQAVLTGTVTQRGDHLEVSAELVDAGRNAHLWGERYDRKFTDIMSVEQEIARAVAERLRPKRSADGAGRGGGSTADPAAYQAYLKGRYHWNKRSDADLKKAIDYFREAIDKDPAYAAAYAGLADTWIGLGWYGYVPPRDGYTRARAAAQKAIEIDPSLAEAHASLAAIAMWYDWDWSVSQREFTRMLELNPNYATGRHWHADLLLMQGRHAEAIAEGKKALELDPLSLIINSWLGRRYYFARRYDDAVRECRKALELDPNFAPAHWQLGNALREQKRLPDALAELETAVRLSNGNPRYLAYLGHGRAKAGDGAGARAVLDQLTLLAEKGYTSAHDRAVVYAGLGESDRAIEWLEKAFEERPSLLPYLNVEPLWDDLRSDPRFQGMIARLGLEQTRVPSPSR